MDNLNELRRAQSGRHNQVAESLTASVGVAEPVHRPAPPAPAAPPVQYITVPVQNGLQKMQITNGVGFGFQFGVGLFLAALLIYSIPAVLALILILARSR